jgi:hypothetical protein
MQLVLMCPHVLIKSNSNWRLGEILPSVRALGESHSVQTWKENHTKASCPAALVVGVPHPINQADCKKTSQPTDQVSTLKNGVGTGRKSMYHERQHAPQRGLYLVAANTNTPVRASTPSSSVSSCKHATSVSFNHRAHALTATTSLQSSSSVFHLFPG